VEALFARARRGHLAAVLAELRQHLEAHAEDDESRLALGLILADAERWAEAAPPLEHVLRSSQSRVPQAAQLARVALARAKEHQGSLGEARSLLEAALAAAPEHTGVARALASVQRRAGDLSAATEGLRAALARAPRDAARALVACDLGEVAHARGDLAAALHSYEDAARFDSALAGAWIGAAEVRAELVDFAGALRALDAVLVRDASHPTAVRLRAVFERRRAEAHAARLFARPLSAIASSSRGVVATADAAGRVASLFFVAADSEDDAAPEAAVAEGALAFLVQALGAPLSPGAAAYVLAALAEGRALDLDDLRVAAAQREGAHGLLVTRAAEGDPPRPP
jgi:tetratricopeptide (TPR) repeat protein